MIMPVINGHFDCVDDYIAKGRRYKKITRRKLVEDWLAAFKTAATDPCDSSARATLNDLTSEFHFRGKIPPYYQVKQLAYEYIRAVDAALERLQKEYPEGWAAAMRDLQFVIDGGAIDGERNHPVWSGTQNEPFDESFPRSILRIMADPSSYADAQKSPS
jgi:hypothetical protein